MTTGVSEIEPEQERTQNIDDSDHSMGLWATDHGDLPENIRRVLASLITTSHLSRVRRREQWETVLSNETMIRSQLHNLFLDLVVDREHEIAFVCPTEYSEAPQVVRTQKLTFMDTLVLLVLRQTLLTEEGRRRPFIGLDELTDQLDVYRAERDELDYNKRVRSSWNKMQSWGLISKPESDRAEISPMVRYLVDAERVNEIQQAYDRVTSDKTGHQMHGSGNEPDANTGDQ